MMHFNVVRKVEIEYVQGERRMSGEGEAIENPERVSVDDTVAIIEEKQTKIDDKRNLAATTIIPLTSIRKLKVEEIVET